MIDQALPTAESIDDPRAKARALVRTAEALADTDPGLASRLTDQIIAAADRIKAKSEAPAPGSW